MNNNLYEFSKGPSNLIFHKVFYYLFTILKLISTCGIAFSLVLAFSIDNNWYIVALIFVLSLIITWLSTKYFYNYYDYTYVSGSVRIVKIVNNKYRRLVTDFDAKNIISFGKVFGSTYNKYADDKSVKKYYASPDAITENDICIYYYENGEKALLFMPKDDRFLYVLSRYTGNRKIDEDFLKTIKNND